MKASNSGTVGNALAKPADAGQLGPLLLRQWRPADRANLQSLADRLSDRLGEQ